MADYRELIEENVKKDRSDLRFLAICLFIFVWLTMFTGANRYFFYYIEVDGPSMENTLFTGDVLCVNKRVRAVRGDVVIIDGEKGNGQCLVKRVIALGGDTLVIEGGYVWLNGDKLEEDYIKEQGVTKVNGSAERKEYKIPAGEVFYMGDNRAVSQDSRSSFGTCGEEQIVGVVPDWAMSGFVKWFTGLRASVSEWVMNLFG